MSGIIKAGALNGDHQTPHQVAFNFDDMASKANDYLDEVRARAAQIIADAEKEGEQIRERSRIQGHQAAIQAAEKTLRNEVDQRMSQLLPALEASAQSIQSELDAWIQHWEENLLQLAVGIAEKVIRREVQQQPSITGELISEALQLATGQDEISLRINPEDYEILKDQVEQIATRVGVLASTTIVPDRTVTSGGCIVETHYGNIDMQLETQLKRIEKELA